MRCNFWKIKRDTINGRLVAECVRSCVCSYAVVFYRNIRIIEEYWHHHHLRYSPLLECLHVICSCSLTNTFLFLGREKKVIIKLQLFLYLHLTVVCNSVQSLLPAFILFSLPYPRFRLQTDIISRLINSNGTFSPRQITNGARSSATPALRARVQ